MGTTSRIRAGIAAGAIAALAAITGCGGSGSTGAAGLDAAATLNGPYGPGGPYLAALASGTGTSARTAGSDALGNSSSRTAATVEVAGSAALDGGRGLSWTPPLGPGITVGAPPTVRPGTTSPTDAAAGFYDAFYARKVATACGYVVPAERVKCPAMLARSRPGAGTLRSAAIGFVVSKDSAALVTMTGFVCGGRAAPNGCLGQQNAHWIFEYSGTFDALWAGIAREGGNPLTATPLRRVAGRWYVDLAPSTADG